MCGELCHVSDEQFKKRISYEDLKRVPGWDVTDDLIEGLLQEAHKLQVYQEHMYGKPTRAERRATERKNKKKK